LLFGGGILRNLLLRRAASEIDFCSFAMRMVAQNEASIRVSSPPVAARNKPRSQLSPTLFTTMASADSCPALTVQVSPSKVFKLSNRFVRLYLLLLSVTLGFRVCLHTHCQQAASLPIRVPTTVSLLIASFGPLTSRSLALLFATVAVSASDQFLSFD
jgi:hypothetical protein